MFSFLSFLSLPDSINVKGLSPNSETGLLARELVARCELIDPVRLPEVEQLLVYLQNRQSTARGGSAEGKCTYTQYTQSHLPPGRRGRATGTMLVCLLYQ